MRRGCRVELFGKPQGPLRDNIDDARQDAIRLKLGHYDEDGYFYLDAGAELVWDFIAKRAAA
ncbi:hypothetical protein BH10PSE14_BH10PSE14_06370 [soil metagenome]